MRICVLQVLGDWTGTTTAIAGVRVVKMIKLTRLFSLLRLLRFSRLLRYAHNWEEVSGSHVFPFVIIT